MDPSLHQKKKERKKGKRREKGKRRKGGKKKEKREKRGKKKKKEKEGERIRKLTYAIRRATRNFLERGALGKCLEPPDLANSCSCQI